MGRLQILENLVEDGFATRIPAQVWRFDGASGLVRVSAGFPCTPGLVSEANLDKVRVFVSGVEQAVAIEPLRGLHPDGSYRSIGIQLERNLTSGVPLNAEVWVGSRDRGTTDLLWSEPTAASMLNKAVIAPTSAQYLCDSYVGLTVLQPAADDDPIAKAVYGPDDGDVLKDWLDTLIAQGASATYQSTYEHVAGMWHAYLRTGERFFYEAAYDWLYEQMTASTFNPGSNYQDVHAQIVTVDPSMPLPAADASGLPNEQNSGVAFGWATGYLMTGWKQPWRQLCFKLSWRFAGNELVFSTVYSPRWNMQLLASWALAGYCVEATMQVPSQFGGYGAGRDPNTTTYAQQLPSILTECEEWAYDGFGSGFADGLVAGVRQTATDDYPSAGRFPLFQLSITARALIHYYNSIAPDSRIPGWVRGIADVLIAQATIDGTGADWPYSLTDTSGGTPTPSPSTNYDSSYYAEIFGFAYATETDPTTKATYLDWLERAVRAANYSEFGAATGKAFGQWLGANMQSAAYYLSGGLPRGITGAHPTTITEPPIWSS